MTNDNIITIIEPLVVDAANHIRIHTAIAEGKHKLAASLIVTRMIGSLEGWADGDIVEDEAILTALHSLNSMPGCLAQRAMDLAALKHATR